MELVGNSSVADTERRNATRWSTGATSFIFRSRTASVRQSDGTAEIRDYHKDSVISGQAQKESIMGGIITLLTPAPIIDPFHARESPIFMP